MYTRRNMYVGAGENLFLKSCTYNGLSRSWAVRSMLLLMLPEHICMWNLHVPKNLPVALRLSLGGRSVGLLPVAQRTNALTKGVVCRTWAAGREFESNDHHENAFRRKVNFLMSRIWKNTHPGPPEIGTAGWWHVDPYIRSEPEYPAVVICLSLGRRSVNLLPVAQRTNAFTNGRSILRILRMGLVPAWFFYEYASHIRPFRVG